MPTHAGSGKTSPCLLLMLNEGRLRNSRQTSSNLRSSRWSSSFSVPFVYFVFLFVFLRGFLLDEVTSKLHETKTQRGFVRVAGVFSWCYFVPLNSCC